LPAIMTYAVANTCLQKFVGFNGPPTLEGCAQLTQQIADHFLKESAAQLGNEGLFHFVVFGWCPASEQYRAFVSCPIFAKGAPVSMGIHEEPLDDQNVIIIGSNDEERTRLRQRIAQIRESAPEFERRGGAPRMAIEEIVSSETIPGVGGGLQVGLAWPNVFHLFAWMREGDPTVNQNLSWVGCREFRPGRKFPNWLRVVRLSWCRSRKHESDPCRRDLSRSAEGAVMAQPRAPLTPRGDRPSVSERLTDSNPTSRQVRKR
jgi:hypothetical protein